MLYQFHEWQRLWMAPWRSVAEATKTLVDNPFNPWAQTPLGKVMASTAGMFEFATRRFGKPEFGLQTTTCDGREVAVSEETLIQRTWCHLLHFKRDTRRRDPKVLIVAPLSGHYATLLRGTVETMLPDHDVYITDWQDARMVPLSVDRFNLNDYIDYIIDFLHFLGPNTHVIAVCQPSVPVMAATSVMSQWGDYCVPATMTLMGGPIDTRKSPTQVNKLAGEKPLEWFEQNVIQTVPPPFPGAGRRVYPGFIQLTNFMAMNFDRHLEAQGEIFDALVKGDEELADKRRGFYEEYLAVMDLPAEFYLQTIETVFKDHALPDGKMIARWHPVIPECITRTAILCVEGELDDISGIGQTRAALDLASNLPADMKRYHLQKGVGHYGVFGGSKFRAQVAPVIGDFIREFDHELGKKPVRRAASPGAWHGPDRRTRGGAKPGSRAAPKKSASKAKPRRRPGKTKTG